MSRWMPHTTRSRHCTDALLRSLMPLFGADLRLAAPTDLRIGKLPNRPAQAGSNCMSTISQSINAIRHRHQYNVQICLLPLTPKQHRNDITCISLTDPSPLLLKEMCGSHHYHISHAVYLNRQPVLPKILGCAAISSWVRV